MCSVLPMEYLLCFGSKLRLLPKVNYNASANSVVFEEKFNYEIL